MATKKLERETRLGELVGELKKVLELHGRQHRDLLSVVERKKQALVRMDREDLEATLGLEQEAVAAVGLVEQRRLELTRDLADLVDSPAGAAMRLAELIQHLGEDDRDELLERREELRDIADRLDRLNQLNRTMTQQTIGHFQLFITLLSGRDPEAKTYNRRGTLGDEPSPLLVDRRI